MNEKLAEACSRILPGDVLTEVLTSLGDWPRISKTVDVVDGQAETILRVEDADVSILTIDGITVEAIEYGPGFGGIVNNVRIGMTGDEVEQILGTPDRLWPMPHPNYVLIYDAPTFFRVELDRKTEQVIMMLR
jgi:hypothetical protein